MEFERTLFRVHERFLAIDAVKKSVDYCYKISIVLVLVCLPIFLYGNYRFVNTSPCLQPLIEKEFFLDPLNNIDQTNLTVVADRNKSKITNSTFIFFKIADKSQPDFDEKNDKSAMILFEFSGTPQIAAMDPKIREKFNFTTYNITVDASCYSSSRIHNWILKWLDYENILISEILHVFTGFHRYIKNTASLEAWSFPASQIEELTEKTNIFNHLISRTLGILKLLLGLFLVSNITAIYNRMTIICAPVFILAAYRFCTNPAQQQADRMNIYRAFPWIGMYLYTLNVSGRKKDRYIICAFFCMILVFYCLYLAALVFWNLLLFAKSFPKGLDENFYGFLALTEFLVLLFVRTRTTIKFFPKMSITVMLMFLYYVQFTPYGFYNLGLFIVSWAILGTLAYFLRTFEIPAINWNPSYHYTPSIDSPRTLFVPVFSLTWYHDIPQLWTMFFPMFGRSYFNNTELSMINRNYPLLVQTLENAAQGARAAENQGEENNAGFPLHQIGGNNNQNIENQREQEPANSPPPRPANNGNSNQPNLLQNADSDYVLDMSNSLGAGAGGAGGNTGSNNRLNWSDENSGHRYRRINEP